MQSCGNHLPPNEASLSKHIAECEAQNEELRRIVRWYMRHSGVDMPEEMRVIFNKISGVNQRRFGMSDHKHDREIADGFTITKVCNCFRCSKEAACIKFSMMTGYKLYTNYRLCPMCSVEMMNFLGSDINIVFWNKGIKYWRSIGELPGGE